MLASYRYAKVFSLKKFSVCGNSGMGKETTESKMPSTKMAVTIITYYTAPTEWH